MNNPCPFFQASDAIGGGAQKPRLRFLPDRLRQVAIYEVGGLTLISPLFALAAGLSPSHSVGLLSVLSLIVAAWHGPFSATFDWAERTIAGRRADRRPPFLRVAHAVMLEAGAVFATTPVIAAWNNVSWNAAFLEDLGLTVAYVAYAFVFGLLYDSLFPIVSDRGIAEANNA